MNPSGYFLVQNAFSIEDVRNFRECIKSNLKHFRNTRELANSGHLAGFHRYPSLEEIHQKLTSNKKINNALKEIADTDWISIGLSDITINRSQEWHTDLLRGKYSKYISKEDCWGGANGGNVYKILLYLQDGKSLKIIPGGHTVPRNLQNDEASIPLKDTLIEQIHIQAGDAILMDIRLPHRGSSEEDFKNIYNFAASKVLVTTVIGRQDSTLTSAMELGNAHRLHDWEKKHISKNIRLACNGS